MAVAMLLMRTVGLAVGASRLSAAAPAEQNTLTASRR
ncbi:hypothetical protein ABIA33_000676 [Streptacidiphilus sp. MAP12-16]